MSRARRAGLRSGARRAVLRPGLACGASIGDARRRLKSAPPASTALPSRVLGERLRTRLCAWFERERRDLPWRRTRDPYAIWISEAMLQQTRVETVVPYFARFLARFPDLASLAAAREEEVLAAWSGLGYYSRARALREAARAVIARHGGELPRSRAELLALPGIGPYTAGALLSIAFGASEALVDGNVQRVFARLFALEEPLGSAGLAERCWALAERLVPTPLDGQDPGQWNQALMELGARLCVARAPACASCPLRADCRAFAARRVDELPRPKARPAALRVELEVAVARRGECYLLARRPASGRMAGLLEFPTRELVPSGTPARLWPVRLPAGLTPRGAPLFELAHTITHHRLHVRVRAARIGRELAPSVSLVPASELPSAALTGMTKKVLRALDGGP